MSRANLKILNGQETATHARSFAFIRDYADIARLIAILFGVLAVGALVTHGVLLRPENISNVLQQNSVLLVLVTAQFLVIATGGIDLSVGAAVALASVTFVTCLDAGPVFACLAALGSGVVLGIANGLLVTYVRLPAFVVTLGTMQIGYSAAKLLSGGGTVDTSATGVHIPAGMLSFYGGKALGVPLPVWLAGCVLVIGVVYLRTSIGNFIFAVGGNSRAARLTGIPVGRVSLAAYAAGSMVAAIAGLLAAMRVGYGDPHVGVWLPLDSIAAVSIGGVSLTGGRGNILSGFIGVLIIAFVDNAMNLIGISVLIQPVVKGLILIAAVLAYSRRAT